MFVALVSPYDWEVPGGVQSQVTALARALARLGCTVVVAAPGTPGHSPPAAQVEGFELVPLGRSIRVPVNGSVAPVAPTPTAAARCLALLRRRRPDVVHVHEPFTPGPALAATSLGPTPIVATFHRAGADALYRAEGRALGRLARRLSVMTAVSQAAAETAAEVLGAAARRHEMLIVPNGIELVDGEDAPHRAQNTPPVIAFVGRHEERKGLAVLLEALAKVTVPFEVDVVGDGPQSAELRSRYGGDRRLRWLGAVDDARRAEILRRTDLYVAPSLGGESFGVVLLEAMAAGAPVIASDIPGYRSAAGDGGAARFVPPDDPAALAGAIEQLLGDVPGREALRTAGRARAGEYSMDAVAARYLEVYTEAIGARRGSHRPGP